MPSDDEEHRRETTLVADVASSEEDGTHEGPAAGPADDRARDPSSSWDQGPPPWRPGLQDPPWPAPAPLPRAGVPVLLVALVVVLAACGIGLGLGYAVYRATAPAAIPAGAPTTSPQAAAVAARVDPALVDVDTTLAYETASGAGTGMVVTSSGEVLTNNHVIEGETSIRVTDLGNGRTYDATVVGYDVAADVAVLQLAGAAHLRTVTFARSPATTGQAVVAIGNAGGRGGTPTAVSGTVTALGQAITAEDELSGRVEHLTGLVETDAPIQAGDSGGPLVDAAGRVLGMDTAAGSRFAFAQGAGQGYAIPDGTVLATGTEIARGASSSTVHVGPTAFLGVDVTNAGTTGAVVAEVLPGTSATAIGLAAGDAIVSVDGRAVRNPTALSEVLQAEQPGTTVPIIWQDPTGRTSTATVTLRSGPPA